MSDNNPYSSELAISLKNMKKVIPLMGKYRIPTTPQHYAVWYTYVAQTDQSLNKEIEKAIFDNDVCTAVTSEQLYHDYIASRNEHNAARLKESLEAMVLDLTSTVDDTINDTSNFNTMIDKNFSRLERFDEDSLSMEEIMVLVKSIVSNSTNIKNSTQLFTDKLREAQNEVAKLKSELAQVKTEATRDPLTQLYNRRAFDCELNEMLTKCETFSLIMADLDHFKQINDTYGHVFGDTTLKAVSKVLKERLKEVAHIYRYGGEEIAILIPGKNLSIAKKMADMCRTSIEKISIKDQKTNTQLKNITASFGVATYQKGDSPQELIDRADKQLYQAKKLGRNRVMPMTL